MPGYGDQMSHAAQPDETTGPENPRSDAGPDAPAPPGGPQRTDAADGSTTPGGPARPDTEPDREAHAHGASGQSGRGTDSPTPEPTADGEIHARTQADQVNEQLQEENAETALDQPSDGSGSD